MHEWRVQFVHVKWLGNVFVGTIIKASDNVLALVECRQHQHRHLRKYSQPAADFPAVHSWHHDIKNHQIGPLLLNHAQTVGTTTSLNNTITLVFQIDLDQLTQAGLIINDEDLALLHQFLAFLNDWQLPRVEVL